MNHTKPIETIHPWTDRELCCQEHKPCIEVRDLSVSYGSKPALRDVTLAIPQGCITAIVGPSGCGKSTFLNCLNRMTDLMNGCHVAGSVRFEGHEITGRNVDLVALRRRIGMIFQRPNPFPLSIRENLTFPLKHHRIGNRADRDDRAEAVLRRVGLWDEVKDRLAAPALGLSGGQQQRLCLARALVLSPQVLLLDEPCSSLDPLASAVVEDLITSLRGSYTVVVVTHNLAQARRIADDVAVFWVVDDVGKLIEHGRAATIFETPGSEITAAYIRGARG